jgi:hypothetical protein
MSVSVRTLERQTTPVREGAMASPTLRHTPPVPLFDPAAGERPPHDAVEVYLEPPPALSAVYEDCGQRGRVGRAVEAAWSAGRDAAFAALRKFLYVKVGFHQQRRGMNSVGKFWPAQLRVTHLSHVGVPDSTGGPVQLHDHVYIGATALPDVSRDQLPADEAGAFWPIDLYSLRHDTSTILNAVYNAAICREFTARTGARWREVRPGVRAPLVIEGWEAQAATVPRVLCPGLPRSAPDPPLSQERFIADALAAEPDAIEERQWQIRIEAGGAFLTAMHLERLVIHYLVYPSTEDDFDDDLY